MKIIIDNKGVNVSYSEGLLVLEKEDGLLQEIPLVHITSLHLYSQSRVSTSAILECVKSEIPVFIEDKIEVSGMFWSPFYGSLATIRKKQSLLSLSKLKYKVIQRLLMSKQTTRLEWLKPLMSSYHYNRLSEDFTQINNEISTCVDDNKLRSLEAHASKKYFEEYFRLFPEGMVTSKREYRGAVQIINQLLNYGYGVLYKQITKSSIHAGLDPHVGLFHQPQHNKPTLSYDLVEAYRPYIERWVYEFVKDKKDMIGHEGESAGLSASLKKAFIDHLFSYFSNMIITRNNKKRSLESHIQIEMHQFASYIKNLEIEELKKALI